MSLDLNGKCNTAHVFTDNIDSETISQIILLCNQEFAKDSNIRIMPDCHAGAGCVIGTTMTITDKIVPNLVGVDIGCGMQAIKIKEHDIDLEKLDKVINERVPSGFSIHEIPVSKCLELKELIAPYDHDYVSRSCGTLGGGNHFIELDIDSNGDYWLVIHSGSRKLGVSVCEYYQRAGYKKIKDDYQSIKIDATIAKLKAEGKQRDIENTIKILKMQAPDIPKDLAYVEGDLMADYLHDMKLAQYYAFDNRYYIGCAICSFMGWTPKDFIDTKHNYIDMDNMILRKGAISAKEGELCIIPMNMRDGTLLCKGKGNPDWNYSAPHGAGRILSRSQAMSSIKLDDFRNSMNGIYSSSVMESTLDEAPMVYKPMQEIMDCIKDTIEIIDILKPVYNFKAH